MTNDEHQELEAVAAAVIAPLLRPIVEELAGIRKALETAIAPPVAAAGAPVCAHPVEARIDFGVTDGIEDWQCRACGFRTVKNDG